MSFTPNRFNLHGDGTPNYPGFAPNQMNPNSNMVRSSFITSDHRNHHGDHMFSSSSSSYTCFQNSHVSSSSFGYNNSHMTNHMMRRNTDFVSATNYFPVRDNPHLTQVSFTQTITNRYTAIVPMNTLNPVQYDVERLKHAMNYRPNVWNPAFHSSNVRDQQCEILSPEPLNVVYPRHDSAYRQHPDVFPLSSQYNHVVPEGRSLKRIIKRPTNLFEKGNDYTEFAGEDNDTYDGRTHSLPHEKYGPYTCPKCMGVFDTSQKFAAHTTPCVYRDETAEERNQRLRARNKGKLRKLNDEIHGVNSNGISEDQEASQPLVVVKEELA